jgi:type II secretory pathway pseudopilin PulG
MQRSTLEARLREERGSSLIELLLALGLVALVVAIGVQGFAYAQARLIAAAAAEDGARSAASAGAAAGLVRSREVLAAGGGAARGLAAAVSEQQGGVTVSVAGRAAGVFPLSLIVPSIRASATLPVEAYPTDERAAP